MIVKLHESEPEWFSANQIYYADGISKEECRMSKRLLGVIIASLVLMSMVSCRLGLRRSLLSA